MNRSGPCLCGDPECRWCFPSTWKRERLERLAAEAGVEPEDYVDRDELAMDLAVQRAIDIARGK